MDCGEKGASILPAPKALAPLGRMSKITNTNTKALAPAMFKPIVLE